MIKVFVFFDGKKTLELIKDDFISFKNLRIEMKDSFFDFITNKYNSIDYQNEQIKIEKLLQYNENDFRNWKNFFYNFHGYLNIILHPLNSFPFIEEIFPILKERNFFYSFPNLEKEFELNEYNILIKADDNNKILKNAFSDATSIFENLKNDNKSDNLFIDLISDISYSKDSIYNKSNILHFIGHGENIDSKPHWIINNKKIDLNEMINNLSNIKLIISQSCFPIDNEFSLNLNNIMKNGTSIILPIGRIKDNSYKNAINDFYKEIKTNKEKLITCFKNITQYEYRYKLFIPFIDV